ncbi:MAG: DNA primase, partial [Lachnospiraceae bacterium]
PVYRQVAELLYAQHEEGSLVPARIISVFADDAQKQSEVAKLFHSPPAEGDAVWEKEHTLQEIICRVKELALRRMKEELNPADMQQMQRFIQMRNELDALRKTHISLDLG